MLTKPATSWQIQSPARAAVVVSVRAREDDPVAREVREVAGDVEPRRVGPADLVVARIVVEEEDDVRRHRRRRFVPSGSPRESVVGWVLSKGSVGGAATSERCQRTQRCSAARLAPPAHPAAAPGAGRACAMGKVCDTLHLLPMAARALALRVLGVRQVCVLVVYNIPIASLDDDTSPVRGLGP